MFSPARRETRPLGIFGHTSNDHSVGRASNGMIRVPGSGSGGPAEDQVFSGKHSPQPPGETAPIQIFGVYSSDLSGNLTYFLLWTTTACFAQPAKSPCVFYLQNTTDVAPLWPASRQGQTTSSVICQSSRQRAGGCTGTQALSTRPTKTCLPTSSLAPTNLPRSTTAPAATGIAKSKAWSISLKPESRTGASCAFRDFIVTCVSGLLCPVTRRYESNSRIPTTLSTCLRATRCLNGYSACPCGQGRCLSGTLISPTATTPTTRRGSAWCSTSRRSLPPAPCSAQRQSRAWRCDGRRFSGRWCGGWGQRRHGEISLMRASVACWDLPTTLLTQWAALLPQGSESSVVFV
mmetsp:Transcript_637/g.1179  ORF Transcript_637/g.1179 Transcript_637/m.1179 type:complete len:348 (+) Transcript_637:241-1284(+)